MQVTLLMNCFNASGSCASAGSPCRGPGTREHTAHPFQHSEGEAGGVQDMTQTLGGRQPVQ